MKLKLKKTNGVLVLLAKLKTLPTFLAENAFFTCLALISASLIFGGLLFYKYGFLVERRTPEISQKEPLIEEAAFQEILRIWQERQERFDQAATKEYNDPFR